jgi:hypothetical protein
MKTKPALSPGALIDVFCVALIIGISQSNIQDDFPAVLTFMAIRVCSSYIFFSASPTINRFSANCPNA